MAVFILSSASEPAPVKLPLGCSWGQALMGLPGPSWARPLWAPLGPYEPVPCGPGPYGPPWALMGLALMGLALMGGALVGRALMGPWALMGRALMGRALFGPHGPLRAGP